MSPNWQVWRHHIFSPYNYLVWKGHVPHRATQGINIQLENPINITSRADVQNGYPNEKTNQAQFSWFFPENTPGVQGNRYTKNGSHFLAKTVISSETQFRLGKPKPMRHNWSIWRKHFFTNRPRGKYSINLREEFPSTVILHKTMYRTR